MSPAAESGAYISKAAAAASTAAPTPATDATRLLAAELEAGLDALGFEPTELEAVALAAAELALALAELLGAGVAALVLAAVALAVTVAVTVAVPVEAGVIAGVLEPEAVGLGVALFVELGLALAEVGLGLGVGATKPRQLPAVRVALDLHPASSSFVIVAKVIVSLSPLE